MISMAQLPWTRSLAEKSRAVTIARSLGRVFAILTLVPAGHFPRNRNNDNPYGHRDR